MICLDCGKDFCETEHNIKINLDKNTTVRTNFFIKEENGTVWQYCKPCLEKNLQANFDEMNEDQKAFMKEQLTKRALKKITY